MATKSHETGRPVALEQIRVPENVCALDDTHVQALAGSISLQGMLVPVVVRDDGDGFELVAGFHRIAAAKSLGLAEVPVVVRDAQTEDADRAVENITRKQLNPYEEAKAVKAMLGRGHQLGHLPPRVPPTQAVRRRRCGEAGDQLEAVAVVAHHDRNEHPPQGDRRGEGPQVRVVELANDLRNPDLVEPNMAAGRLDDGWGPGVAHTLAPHGIRLRARRRRGRLRVVRSESLEELVQEARIRPRTGAVSR